MNDIKIPRTGFTLRGLNATTTLTMPGGGRCSVRITLGPGPTSRGISSLRPLSSSPVQTCRAFDLVFSSPGPLVSPQGDRETAPVHAPHALPVIYAPQGPVSSSPRPIRARTPPCPGRVTPGKARAWGQGTLENEPPIQLLKGRQHGQVSQHHSRFIRFPAFPTCGGENTLKEGFSMPPGRETLGVGLAPATGPGPGVR